MTSHDALLPSPPFVEVDGINNFRDAGGFPIECVPGNATPARSVRRGLLYRCADPSYITPAGKKKVQSLGVTTIFDLRAEREVKQRGEEAEWNIETIGLSDDEPNGADTESHPENGDADGAQKGSVKRVFIPAFPTQDTTPEGLAIRYAAYATGSVEGFTQAYTDILRAAGPSYAHILRHLRDYPTSPIIIHCTAGKDRTGVIVALILKLAGVTDEIVADEYQLTEVGLGPMREQIVKHLLGRAEVGGERGKALSMIGARKEYMLATLKVLRDEFGGAEGYVKSNCGLSDADIVRIRENVTVEAAPIHYAGRI